MKLLGTKYDEWIQNDLNHLTDAGVFGAPPGSREEYEAWDAYIPKDRAWEGPVNRQEVCSHITSRWRYNLKMMTVRKHLSQLRMNPSTICITRDALYKSTLLFQECTCVCPNCRTVVSYTTECQDREGFLFICPTVWELVLNCYCNVWCLYRLRSENYKKRDRQETVVNSLSEV